MFLIRSYQTGAPMAKLGRFKNERSREAFLGYYDAVRRQWPVPAEELDVATSFGPTHVRRSGDRDGPPIVLVPGSLGTSLSWSRLVEPLAHRHLVLAVDTIGTPGRSVQTAPLTGAADLGRWMSELLAGLGVERPAHLVGYSEGGFVAGCAAVEGAAPLASLIAIEPAGFILRLRWRFLASLVGAAVRAVFSRGGLRAFAERMAPGVEVSDEEWAMIRAGGLGFRPTLPFPRRMTDDELRSLTVPTLFLLGAATELYDPRRAARRAEALVPSVEVDIVPGVGHGLPFQLPERTVDAITSFVARYEPHNPAQPASDHRDPAGDDERR
jgi:pimeloyl-ACP methyl ester carboxylesterase